MLNANVFWTYVANFPERAQNIRGEGRSGVLRAIHGAFSFYSNDFWQKAHFHIFWSDGTYEKLSALQVEVEAESLAVG